MEPLSLEEATERVTQSDPRFALTTAIVRGVEFPVFSHAPDNLREMMKQAVENHDNGKREFLVFEDERWSYGDFCTDVNHLAQVLQSELGVQKGQKIAVAMRNVPELLILMMAIPAVGGVVVFLNGWWTTSELDYALGDSGARIIFADGIRAERLQPLAGSRDLHIIGVREGEEMSTQTYSQLLTTKPRNIDEDGAVIAAWPDTEIHPDDDFAIMYSSGTTGHPKGVVQTHRGAISAVYSWLMSVVMLPLMSEPDPHAAAPLPPCMLIVTPLFHVTATHPMFLLSIPAGAKIVVMGKWNAKEAVRIIEKEQVTRFLGVPTQSADLMQAAKDAGASLSSLNFLGSGGAKRPAAQVAQLQEVFPHASIASGWGMTETNAIGLGITGPDYVARPGAAGRLYPPLQQLKLLDDDGQEVPLGEIGEITVKSAANMRCYLNQPEATAEVLQDGWLKTGDLAVIDEEGYVTIVDRKKNIIIRGGENISCLDVEGAIHGHPDVIEAGAFSVPHERLGEVVGAGIQVAPGKTITAEEMSLFLIDHVAKFKIPEHYWFQHEPLPRGATDKTDRRVLRAQCLKL